LLGTFIIFLFSFYKDLPWLSVAQINFVPQEENTSVNNEEIKQNDDSVIDNNLLVDPLLIMAESEKTTKTPAKIIPFTKFREVPTRLRLSYNKITRNGVTSTLPNTNIVYDWKDKKGVLTDLDTKVIIKGVERNVFNYKKLKNATIIKERTSSGIITTTKKGFVVVTVKTEGDSLKVNY